MPEPSPPSGPLRIRAPRGTADLLPTEVHRWRAVEALARELFARYGYQEVRTPLIEHTALFVRSIGEVTDVVEKEMYTFGAGADSVTLRPEGTASAVRAYLEHGCHRQARFQKWYYIGPMFRRERPQAGRQRQFHQIGVEVLGSGDPLLDVEVMGLAWRFFEALGLTGQTLYVNTIGCPGCRGAYREVLKRELGGMRAALCENCRARFERNVFRILDCKEEQCRRLCASLPPMREHLCAPCRDHWEAVAAGLDRFGPRWELDDRLVRGFDYYTRTVFEVRHGALGARDAICGGGRYDHLIAELGGPDLGALGFAAGTEATLLAAEKTGVAPGGTPPPRAAVFVVSITPAERPAAFEAVTALREAGISADMDHEGRSPRKQMRAADALGAPLAAIVGPDETAAGTVKVRRMDTGGELAVPRAELARTVKRLLAEVRAES